MKNKIKGLLALVLSVLIGQAWAADPVATWTDFRNPNSGEYTLTKDESCTVNTDGSITLGGTGLTLPVGGDQVTVVMEVSGVPTESGITVVSVMMGGQYVSLKSNGTQLIQSWNNGGDYGTFDWSPAKRQTIVLGTMQSNPSGTTTWIDGVQKATNNGLMTTNGDLQNVYIGSYSGTGADGTVIGSAAGMVVHSLRLYSTKLSGDDVVSDIIANGGTVAAPVVINSDETLETSCNLNFSNGGNAINVRGTLNVLSGEVTFNAGNESVNGTVNISEGATFVATTQIFGSSGAVTGAGKLVVNGYPSNADARNSLSSPEWTGTYVNTADNTLADNNNWLGAVGNTNSVVEFTGASSGFLAKAGSMNAVLKVTGSITFNNGFSDGGGYTFNGALLGDGTLATSGNQTDVLKFLGETKDFAGTITVDGGHCIAFGGQADTANNSQAGKIVIAAGKTANIAAGKTWTAVNGIEVSGTIGGEGTIGSTLILADGATIDVTDGALVVNGDVTIADGATVNVTLPTAATAGTTVLTCNNADAVKAKLVAPEGLRYVAEDGAVKLAAIPVAQIGETPYETLQAACEAAKEGDIVVLIADTEENCVVKEGFNGTIDLGGKTLTGRIFSKSATMTIQNGTIVRKWIGDDKSSSNGAIEIQGGSLTLQDTLSVQILADNVTHLIRLRNSASCVINGGNYSITSTGTDATILYPSAAGTTMIVNGGTFTYDTTNASMPSIANIFGTLTVNGGTFNAYGQSYLFNIDNVGGKTYVKNGLFNCSSSGRLTYNNPTPGDPYGYLEFLGGKYECNPKSSRGVIAEGYASGLLEDNYYIVSKAYAVGLTVDTAKATVDGLNDVHACGTIVSFTVAAATGYKVTSVKLGTEELTAVDGNYTFKMPAEAVTITVTTEAASTFDVMINGQPVADADALKLAANSTTTMTVPETSTWTAEGNVLKKDGVAYVTFADYYTVVVDGTTVTLKLNKPVIGDSAEGADDAFTVTTDAVTIKITNYNKDLNYGVRIAADINSLKTAEITEVETEDGIITLTKSGDSAFFEVVVSDVPFAE